jgi:hypothetical protein
MHLHSNINNSNNNNSSSNNNSNNSGHQAGDSEGYETLPSQIISRNDLFMHMHAKDSTASDDTSVEEEYDGYDDEEEEEHLSQRMTFVQKVRELFHNSSLLSFFLIGLLLLFSALFNRIASPSGLQPGRAIPELQRKRKRRPERPGEQRHAWDGQFEQECDNRWKRQQQWQQ